MKKVKYKCIVLCVIALLVSMFSGVTTFAVSQGNTVVDANSGLFRINGTEPPKTSNETITLGEYNGTITWATAKLYSDKWVKTSGTTIKLDGCFGSYLTKKDAINKKNRLKNFNYEVTVWLADSSHKIVESKKIPADGSQHTVSFTVTANKDYYVGLNFKSGYYHSGNFRVYK